MMFKRVVASSVLLCLSPVNFVVSQAYASNGFLTAAAAHAVPVAKPKPIRPANNAIKIKPTVLAANDVISDKQSSFLVSSVVNTNNTPEAVAITAENSVSTIGQTTPSPAIETVSSFLVPSEEITASATNTASFLVPSSSSTPSFLLSDLPKVALAPVLKTSGTNTASSTKKAKKGRIEAGVGYQGARGSNVYATWEHQFINSALSTSAQLSNNDNYIDAQHIFRTDKKLLDTPVLLGYNARYRDYSLTPDSNTTKAKIAQAGGLMILNFSEHERLITSAGIEYIKNIGVVKDTQRLYPIAASYINDTRVDPMFPTEGKGGYSNFKVETSLFGTRYMAASARLQKDLPLNNNFALSFKGFAGAGKGFGGDALPITKRYYSDVDNLVRGFSTDTFGLNDNNEVIGGETFALGSTELWFPFFHESLRGFTFIDAGTMSGFGSNSRIRFSSGVGISWKSPIGNLRLSYGQAINARSGDKRRGFNLSFGISY